LKISGALQANVSSADEPCQLREKPVFFWLSWLTA
jgi:hypothetical protein